MSQTELSTVEPADGDGGLIIHDIQPVVSTAPAIPKPKAITGVNVGTPIEASVDLAYEVLDYLTDPDNNTSL